jgi:hypothetical protein
MHRRSGAFGADLDVYTEVVAVDAVRLPSPTNAVSGGVQGRIAILFGLSLRVKRPEGGGLAAQPLQGLTHNTTRKQPTCLVRLLRYGKLSTSEVDL